MTRTALCLSFLLLAPPFASAQVDPWEDLPLVKVSEIDLPPSVLQGAWIVGEGLRIDDLTIPAASPASVRPLVEALAKQATPIGVRSAADFTLVSTTAPINAVTVRVFIFDEVSRCQAWWKKKYEGDGWEQYYEKVDFADTVAVRSLETQKLALACGRVWLTSHQIVEGDEYKTAARHVLKQLIAEKRGVKEPEPHAAAAAGSSQQ